jgi:peptide/nickel transport system substrate-binding protein
MRLKKPAVVLATAALMTLAACGGGSSSGKNPNAVETVGAGGNAGAGQDPTAQAPAADVPGAQKGGTVTVDAYVSPSTLDPTRAYYTDSTAILSGLVTRSLTQYKYDPKTNQMVLVPDMATDLGQPNEDNTEWTFTLRDGLKYEDGTPVKAEDVAYAVKRSFAVDELPDGPTYNQTFFLDGDKYKGPFKDGLNYKGVVVKGNKITIKMRRPFGDMAYYASFPAFSAIPAAKDKDPQKYGNHPMATGPYKFATYRPGQSLTLVKNTNWDPSTDPARHQYADKFVFNWNQNQSKTDNVLIDDQAAAQTTISYTDVLTANYAKARQTGRLTQGTSPCTYMWYLDTKKIKDVNVRRAIGWAYPYRAAWRAGGYIEGVTRQPSSTLLPPGTAGRTKFEPQPGMDGKTTDPKKAKALLKKANAMGFEVRFPYQTNVPESVKAKDQIVKALEDAGFKATPVAATSDTVRDMQSDATSDINVRSSGWCSDWPSGGSWFPAIFDGTLVGQAGMPNQSQIDEPEINKGIDSILDNKTGAAANKAWGQLDKTMMQKYYPAVLIGYTGVAYLNGSKIGGVSNDSVRGVPNFTNLYVKK